MTKPKFHDRLISPKVSNLEEAIRKRAELRVTGVSMVMTNGCFDLLHAGHVFFLNEAAKLGDELWVMVNSDKSVKRLKGPHRPIWDEIQRSYNLASLECVSRVHIFHNERLDHEIVALEPDVYSKAGDYSLETLHPEERGALERVGATIRFLPFLEGFSTTAMIENIRSSGDL